MSGEQSLKFRAKKYRVPLAFFDCVVSMSRPSKLVVNKNSKVFHKITFMVLDMVGIINDVLFISKSYITAFCGIE